MVIRSGDTVVLIESSSKLTPLYSKLGESELYTNNPI